MEQYVRKSFIDENQRHFFSTSCQNLQPKNNTSQNPVFDRLDYFITNVFIFKLCYLCCGIQPRIELQYM